MGQAFAVETTIARPAEAVWTVLTDWERMPQWMSGIDTAHLEGAAGPGATLQLHARGKDRTSEVTRYEANQELVLRSTQGRVTADYTYTLTPAGDSTRVSLVAEFSVDGVLRLLWPLLKIAVRLTDAGQLKALKALVESPLPSPAPG